MVRVVHATWSKRSYQRHEIQKRNGHKRARWSATEVVSISNARVPQQCQNKPEQRKHQKADVKVIRIHWRDDWFDACLSYEAVDHTAVRNTVGSKSQIVIAKFLAAHHETDNWLTSHFSRKVVSIRNKTVLRVSDWLLRENKRCCGSWAKSSKLLHRCQSGCESPKGHFLSALIHTHIYLI